jgi:hypothetical protein
MTNAISGLAAVAVDSADPQALAGFWRQLLGGETVVDGDGDVQLIGGAAELIFMRVAGAKSGKNRLHLDLRSADYRAAVAFAVRAGATRADDVYVGPRWTVLRDPEGNEFCILPPRGP